MGELLVKVNALRAQGQVCGGRSMPVALALTWSNPLGQAAERHSYDMASHNFMDHTGSDRSTPPQRMGEAGYGGWSGGENIAAGYSSVDAVLRGWLASPGHCSALMNPGFTDFGGSCAYNSGTTYGFYWTVTLGTSR